MKNHLLDPHLTNECPSYLNISQTSLLNNVLQNLHMLRQFDLIYRKAETDSAPEILVLLQQDLRHSAAAHF